MKKPREDSRFDCTVKLATRVTSERRKIDFFLKCFLLACFVLLLVVNVTFHFRRSLGMFSYRSHLPINFWVSTENILDNFKSRFQYSKCQREYDSFTIHETEPSNVETACQRKSIVPSHSCDAMTELLHDMPETCSNYKEAKLCTYEETTNSQIRGHPTYKFDCSFAREQCIHLEWGVLHRDSGQMVWTAFVSHSNIEADLMKLYPKFNTMLLRCKAFNQNIGRQSKLTLSGHLMQVMWFLKQPKVNKMEEQRTRHVERPSISALLIDSTSRTQFYRSSPKTLEIMKKLIKSSTRKVLDFKLYQSVRAATAWSLWNLFDGPDANRSMNAERNFYYKRFDRTYQKFRRAGYTTGISLDHCYELYFADDRSYANKTLLDATKEAFSAYDNLNVDSIGLAEVSCEILKQSSDSNIAWKKTEKCMNGRHFVDYQLSQLLDQQKSWLSQNLTFMTFMETNINHCGTMSFGSVLDAHLSNYLKEMLKYPDIMFFVFADHGNHYVPGYNVFQAPEGQTDIYHPFLFVILPENERKYFSRSSLEALSTNQNRLITIRDFHHLFTQFVREQKSASDTNQEYGLLGDISPQRTCWNMDSSLFEKGSSPICICEHDYDFLTQEETKLLLPYLEREMNALRVEAAGLSETRNIFLQACPYLELEEVPGTKLESSKSNSGGFSIKGSLRVKNYQFQNSEVVFQVSADVNYNTQEHEYTNKTVVELTNFMRIDIYSRFKFCIPNGYDSQKLCVCAPNQREKKDS